MATRVLAWGLERGGKKLPVLLSVDLVIRKSYRKPGFFFALSFHASNHSQLALNLREEVGQHTLNTNWSKKLSINRDFTKQTCTMMNIERTL